MRISDWSSDVCSSDLLDRALVLDPNLSAAWYLSGFQRIARGDHDDAIGRFARAMRLSPLDPEMVRMQTGTAMAPRSEEHTSELQSLMRISYAVFCLQ